MPNNANIYIVVSSKDQASKILKGIGAAAEDMGEDLENTGKKAGKGNVRKQGLERESQPA